MTFNPLDYLISLEKPKYVSGRSAWVEHIPFAFAIVSLLRPKVIVELGTHYGDSYCAFCQAVVELKLTTNCYAIDTWQGDEHSGAYGADVLEVLRQYHDAAYGEFSHLIKMTFDEGAHEFEDGSIDLLHIDGLHTYEAVKHDFETWLPKLSRRGVVLFHDTHVRERDFGVWRLWEELREKYPGYEFRHGFGLGLIVVGEDVPSDLKMLLGAEAQYKEAISHLFHKLGASVSHDIASHNHVMSLNAAVARRDAQITLLTHQLEQQQEHIDLIHGSIYWRTREYFQRLDLRPKLRPVLRVCRAAPRLIRKKTDLMKRGVAVWRKEGFGGVMLRILRRAGISGASNRRLLLHSIPELAAADVVRMRAEIADFPACPLISLIVPVFNTPGEWLAKMIESVRGQIYPHWELCIADDASTAVGVRALLQKYEREDRRIRVVYREENGQISAASNSALAIAQGEYIALLDHDDELTLDALYWVIKEIAAHPNVDVIYSDEDKIDVDGNRTDIFFKPDWSPELMFNCMYMGHLGVYRKAFLDRVGGFRSEFNFSQDYDLALRATELTQQIRHIPRILYHWRRVEGSAARGDKPYARASNLGALQDAVKRRGLTAQVIELPTANRVKIVGWQPRVSIVIPTDSEANLRTCLDALVEKTVYPSWEIVVVTNSKLSDRVGQPYTDLPITYCRYDKSYNFSDKCNVGAQQANGEIVIFLNDDVRPLSGEWLEDLIELLAIPEVGAVAPKLLYENNRIQHAGLVTGVRGLVGTAFHSLPANTTEHFNFAQSVRDVSALSGACLAMRRRDFLSIGGFDAANTPIMHSDVDLCFKVREKGLRCVYTPHATLLHIGHLSLEEFDKKRGSDRQDKADIFLLKRWGAYIARDPYFSDNMRSVLYRDSPEPISMEGQNRPELVCNRPDVLVVSHDLSASGAPMVAYYVVKHLLLSGAFPVVASPTDGAMRALFSALGVPVIIDSLLLTRHETVKKLARNFDCVVANTVISWPVVYQLLDTVVPVMWYLHESHLIPELVQTNPMAAHALRTAKHIYTGSGRAASFCQPFNHRVKILNYGVSDNYRTARDPVPAKATIVFSIFGSIEPRKGQDVLLKAIRLLGDKVGGKATFNFIGRTLNERWAINVKNLAEDLASVSFRGAVSHEEYVELMENSDVIVCPSRDDTLPLVTLDALGMGKVLICSDATGTSEFMTSGKDGVVVRSEDAEALAEAIAGLIEDPASIARMGAKARQTFLRHFTEDKFARRIVDVVRAVSRVDFVDKAMGTAGGVTSGQKL